MSKAHGRARVELEKQGADPEVDDVEGTASEDTWFRQGARRWLKALLRKPEGPRSH